MKASRSSGTVPQLVIRAVTTTGSPRQTSWSGIGAIETHGAPGQSAGHVTLSVHEESFNAIVDAMSSPKRSVAHVPMHVIVNRGESHWVNSGHVERGFEEGFFRLTTRFVGPPPWLKARIVPRST